DARQACRRQQIDDLDLLLGRDEVRLDLEPIAGPHLAHRHALRQPHAVASSLDVMKTLPPYVGAPKWPPHPPSSAAPPQSRDPGWRASAEHAEAAHGHDDLAVLIQD